MEISFNARVRCGDAALDDFVSFVYQKSKEIAEETSEIECAVREVLLNEISGRIHDMLSELYYEQADFLATAGDNGGEE